MTSLISSQLSPAEAWLPLLLSDGSPDRCHGAAACSPVASPVSVDALLAAEPAAERYPPGTTRSATKLKGGYAVFSVILTL